MGTHVCDHTLDRRDDLLSLDECASLSDVVRSPYYQTAEMACCLKACLRVLGIEDRRSVRTPHPNAVGLYDMSTIQTSATVKRAKHVRLGGQQVAGNQKTHNLNDTKESIKIDDMSPRSRIAQQEKDGLKDADKNRKFTMMPKSSKYAKLIKVLDDAMIETQNFNRSDPKNNNGLSNVRDILQNTLPWIEITITHERLRLKMLGYTAHVMFETFWRDPKDREYNGTMKWHRKCLNYLESLQTLEEQSVENEAKESLVLLQWEKSHSSLERICFDQMRCLHVKFKILQKYHVKKKALENDHHSSGLLIDEAYTLWSCIQSKYKKNPTKLKMYTKEFQQHCNPQVLVSIMDVEGVIV